MGCISGLIIYPVGYEMLYTHLYIKTAHPHLLLIGVDQAVTFLKSITIVKIESPEEDSLFFCLTVAANLLWEAVMNFDGDCVVF